MVVEPIEEIGQYGGTWRSAFTGTSDFHAYGRNVYEQILRWPRNPQDPVGPGIAKAWEYSADGAALTRDDIAERIRTTEAMVLSS
mgnify:CR=1 FL=1